MTTLHVGGRISRSLTTSEHMITVRLNVITGTLVINYECERRQEVQKVLLGGSEGKVGKI